MKEQGFTLIELLAVIVILAIIALIATPIVLNIISNTKENAQLRSAEMYLDAVEQSVALERMTNTTFKPNTCTITNKGNLNCDGYADIVDVQVNGEKPNNGRITFTEGKITQVELKYENDKTIAMNNKGDLEYKEVLAAGLYAEDGTFTSWSQLIDDQYLMIVSGGLEADTYDAGNYGGTAIEKINGKLVIDNSITRISNFYGLENTKEISIPNSVTKLDTCAFQNCNSLKSIDIPKTITEMPDRVLCGCDNLETINYAGTKAEWGAISFDTRSGYEWNGGCPEITVHCTDGDIIIPENPF